MADESAISSPLTRLRLFLVPILASLFIRILRRTIRIEFRNTEALLRARGPGNRPYILSFWHGRLLLMRYSYPGDRITVMISRHGDGELIARTMGRFGIHATRGSTTIGGAAALREVVRRIRSGWDAAFTPDGPRGPRHVVQPGVVEAARLARAAIVPVTFACSSGRRLRSWDRFLVPMPFSRGLIAYGDPIEIPERADAGKLEEIRRSLEAAMIDLERKADASFE
jgi:lysophospholipid acyltransferase (LPLAT)-like uncharacterized protein